LAGVGVLASVFGENRGVNGEVEVAEGVFRSLGEHPFDVGLDGGLGLGAAELAHDDGGELGDLGLQRGDNHVDDHRVASDGEEAAGRRRRRAGFHRSGLAHLLLDFVQQTVESLLDHRAETGLALRLEVEGLDIGVEDGG
jgi:hypothetical protein